MPVPNVLNLMRPTTCRRLILPCPSPLGSTNPSPAGDDACVPCRQPLNGPREHLVQSTLIILMLGLMLHDQFGPAAIGLSSPWSVLAMMPGLPLMMISGYALACRITLNALNRGDGPSAILRLERINQVYRLSILAHFMAMLWLGLMPLLRHGLGRFAQWPLVDELLMLAIPLAMILAGWWCYYPIDQRLRQASLMSRLDSGLPIHAIWTRSEYLLSQIRHQWALLGVPLLAITGWREISLRLVDPPLQSWLMLIGSAAVFLLTPWAMRYLWDTYPLPVGPLRQDMQALCRIHAIKVRQLLLWQTHGAVANAAVMGLIRPVRFILLSDALLESLERPEVQAVMAHELAHVKKHHMIGLLMAAIGGLELVHALLSLILWLVLSIVSAIGWTPAWLSDDNREIALLLLSLGGWGVLFGWVSRRFERQADTFAVQHLARMTACDDPASMPRATIDETAAMTMVQALNQVALANNISIHKRSWRHGSIAWRQQYLQSLIGRPIGSPAIDRQVRWIGRLSCLGLLLVIVRELGWV